MILKRVSDHLKTCGRDSVFDMAQRFDTTPDALRNMLTVLERKGLVQRLAMGTPCAGGCTQCRPETIELYDWVGERASSEKKERKTIDIAQNFS